MTKSNQIVRHNLDLSKHDIDKLPDDLTILGSACITGNKINRLPDGLVVHRELSIIGTNITQLPDTLVVGNGICLTDTKIINIPEKVVLRDDGHEKIFDFVVVDSNKVPFTLPDNLSTMTLKILNTKMDKLPSNLSTYQVDISLGETDIIFAPDMVSSELIVSADLKYQAIPVGVVGNKINRLIFVKHYIPDDAIFHHSNDVINYLFVFESNTHIRIKETQVSYDKLKNMRAKKVAKIIVGQLGNYCSTERKKEYLADAKQFWKKWRNEIIRHGEEIR